VLLEGGEWTEKHAAGCDAVLFSEIGADVSEEPVASPSPFRGLTYIIYLFHIACFSALNIEAAVSSGVFVPTHQSVQHHIAED
jgi:hypothetical protein